MNKAMGLGSAPSVIACIAIDDAKKAGVNIVFIKCRVYENRLEYIE